jgi:dipeptidyl aminopeptidase/acylaminoacyl peptidase
VAPTTAKAVLTPPAALTMTGVPPVPADMPERIGRYTEFKGAGLLDWSPDGKQLLVAFLRNNRTQLHSASGPGQPLRPLTQGDEPTRSGAFLPGDPGVVVFSRDVGGSEASRVYRLDLATGAETALTAAGRRCDAGAFDMPGTSVVVSCTSLDSATAGNAERAARSVTSEILLVDVRSGGTRVVAELPGAGWFPGGITPDNRSLVVGRFRSISDSEVWMLDLASGARNRLLPRDGEPPASYFVTGFTPDGKQMFIVSNRVGEFNQLYRYEPATHRFESVTAAIPWDVSGGDVSRDRTRMAIITNENGLGALRVFDSESLKPVPVAVPAGLSVTRVRLTDDGRRLAYTAQSARSPSEVRVVDLPSPVVVADNVWAAADTAGMDTSTFQPIDVIEWKSFDGRTISGLIQRPPKKFGGKRPVLVEIHGGPEGQARLGFNGRYNYIVNEMGVALIQPNVRGSTGFGKTFHQLDNGKLREDSVKDIGALLDWIAQQPDLDASRVVVQGGSYGGYMANAVAVHYPDRIRGAMPAVGISNFVSFLERTESYRRDLRRTEYGDERDPAMREFLTRISPLTNAHRIKAPLFVIHGRNDPRVPVQEAEQIAATVSRNGVPVWTMIAENEGHGFAKKENADYLFYARVLFLERFLLDN